MLMTTDNFFMGHVLGKENNVVWVYTIEFVPHSGSLGTGLKRKGGFGLFHGSFKEYPNIARKR